MICTISLSIAGVDKPYAPIEWRVLDAGKRCRSQYHSLYELMTLEKSSIGPS